MNHWEYFFFLFHQGASFIVSNFLFVALFFLLFIALLYKNFKADDEPYKKVYAISLIPFLFPIFMLVWGTFFEHTQIYMPDLPHWQIDVLTGVLILQIGINLVCLVWFNRVRMSVVALALLQMCFTLPFFLAATMSVSGVWM